MEAIDLLRKFLLTGVITLIKPQSKTQLAFGTIIALLFLVLHEQLQVAASMPLIATGPFDLSHWLCYRHHGPRLKPNTTHSAGFSEAVLTALEAVARSPPRDVV